MFINAHHILVPRTLKPIAISKLDIEPTEFKNEIEDYISPSKSITYMLHSQHIINMKITITVSISKELSVFVLKKK